MPASQRSSISAQLKPQECWMTFMPQPWARLVRRSYSGRKMSRNIAGEKSVRSCTPRSSENMMPSMPASP